MASLIVFEASDPSRSSRRRLRRAAAARADVQHPNLVRTRMAGAVNGSVQLALPRHLAPTLREALESGPLHPLECVVLVDGLAQGSQALAKAGLTARNFTPDKVLVDPVRGGILADAGIPPQLLKREPRESDPDLPYRSPEELQRHPLDSRSAVYSLGALLFTALTGAAPFSGAWADIYQAHFAGARPQPTRLRPELPEEIDAVIARAMAVDPSDRYGSPAELARAAATALGDSAAWETFGESAAGSGPGVERAPSERLPRRGRRVMPVLAASAVVACAGLGVLLAQSTAEEAPAPAARVSAGGLSMELPSGWERTPAGRDDTFARPWVLAARPSDGSVAGLAAATIRSRAVLERVFAAAGGENVRREAVRLGPLDAWRYDGLRPGPRQGATAYLAATSEGTVLLVCYARAPHAFTGRARLRECNAATASVALKEGQPLPLASVDGADVRLQRAVETLDSRRARALRRLEAADLARGQVRAARALGWSYGRATAALQRPSPLDPDRSYEDLTGSLRQAGDAYGRLARAARRSNRRAYRDLARDVARRERAVSRELARLNRS